MESALGQLKLVYVSQQGRAAESGVEAGRVMPEARATAVRGSEEEWQATVAELAQKVGAQVSQFYLKGGDKAKTKRVAGA